MLIERLKEIQARDNLTDQQFADKLGIHRASWGRIKSTIVFGKKFLSGVRQAYPELKDVIDIFLSGDVANVHEDVADNITTPSETHQNGVLGVLRAFRRRLYLWLRAVKAKKATK